MRAAQCASGARCCCHCHRFVTVPIAAFEPLGRLSSKARSRLAHALIVAAAGRRGTAARASLSTTSLTLAAPVACSYWKARARAGDDGKACAVVASALALSGRQSCFHSKLGRELCGPFGAWLVWRPVAARVEPPPQRPERGALVSTLPADTKPGPRPVAGPTAGRVQ
jgi:hypothetical protein